MTAAGKLALDDVLDALAELVADKLAARVLKAAVAPPVRPPFDQHSPPAGETKKSYLRKARERRFPTSKLGRRVVCLPEDWDAYLTSARRRPVDRRRPPETTLPAANDTEDADLLTLRKMGVRVPRRVK